MGETLNQYLTKGKQVAVDGELRQNRWEQDGQSRSKVEISANNIQLLGGGREGSGGGGGGRASSAPRPRETFEEEPQGSSEFEDDIPF
jgi:single-strand DNA-binding protein